LIRDILRAVNGGILSLIDLLHALKDVESRHGISDTGTVSIRFQPALAGNRRHAGETVVFFRLGLWLGQFSPVPNRVINHTVILPDYW